MAIYFIIAVECDDGMIQLVNGEKETEGLLEVCVYGQWGTVCEHGFGIIEGIVTCRQLGFGGIEMIRSCEFIHSISILFRQVLW